MLAIAPRLSVLLATLGLCACSSSQVPVGTNTNGVNTGDDGTNSGDGGSGDASPCANQAVEQIACANAPTVQTCDTSTTPPHWVVSCATGESQPSGSVCGSMPINTIGCPNSEPTIVCDAAGKTPHWSVTCPATTDASPGAVEDDASTACDGLPVETIGCANGNEVVTCATDSGAPHWQIVCP